MSSLAENNMTPYVSGKVFTNPDLSAA